MQMWKTSIRLNADYQYNADNPSWWAASEHCSSYDLWPSMGHRSADSPVNNKLNMCAFTNIRINNEFFLSVGSWLQAVEFLLWLIVTLVKENSSSQPREIHFYLASMVAIESIHQCWLSYKNELAMINNWGCQLVVKFRRIPPAIAYAASIATTELQGCIYINGEIG